jgi:histidyl-tRNA synthetase
VGISIGLTRIFSKLVAAGRIAADAKCPTEVLVVLPSEDRREIAVQAAHRLRSRGFNVELHHNAAKVGNQIRYASRKGIPYVWIPPLEDGQTHQVKNLATHEQVPGDLDTWTRH